MAAPPPAFGGDRVFADDPQNVGLPTAIGDLSALFLQNLHFQRQAAETDAERAVIDAQAEQVRLVLAASNASQTRETNIRELQPVTRVPAVQFGNEENVANIRMNNIPVFTGGSGDTIDVMSWISRIFNLAESKRLTFNATINLLIQGSSKGAASYIDEMKQEGKTLHQVVQQLEMRYGSLTTVEDARIKCNNMIRKPDEHLSDFIDRLRLMAKMACRQEPTEPLRRRAIDILVEGNIRRVLPSSVRNALEERIMNRSLMGLPALTARDIEKECLDLEAKRKERKLELKGLAQGKRHNVNVAKYEIDSAEDSSESSDDDDEGDPQEMLINEIKQQQLKYFQRGRPVNGPKVMKRAFKNYNQKFQGRNYGRPDQYGARQAGLYPNPPAKQGPPNKMESGFKPINELLLLANCTKGQCIQCGYDGHLMRHISCALKDKPLMDKACAKCGKGLHSADDCPKVFQRDYKAPVEAEKPTDEHLN
jgi:hypothetical protein